MTKSFKDALNRSKAAIPGIKDGNSVGREKANPFNMKVNKPKFEVLNRNVIGSRGNVVRSKSKAASVRSATLLPQLQEKTRAHVSSFIDRRFGSKESGLSREDVMQERFAREQQRLVKSKRKSRFDLNSLDTDDNENDGVDDEKGLIGGGSLTHGGRSISQMDDDELEGYADDFNGDGEEDEIVGYDGSSAYQSSKGGQLDREFVSSGHFGGPGFTASSRFAEPSSAPKSKQEIMKELIAKSKFYKAERQKIKEENEALCEDVNEAFAAIRGNLKLIKDDEDSNHKADRTVEVDEYESVLKELTFDPRSKPSDRTLTLEEKTEKDRKKMEEQTKALLERMKPSENTENTPVEEIDKDEGSVDPELKRIGARQFELMRSFCHTGSEAAYGALVDYAVKQPRTMILLARLIRTDLGRLATSFTKRSNATGRGAVMPAFGPIRLLLLVARIFSCSDFHHVVATPAQLLLAYYLGVGRMTNLDHVQRALALVYCATQFQEVGKRCVPEALQLLYTLLRRTNYRNFDSSKTVKSHYFCRPLGKKLSLELQDDCDKSIINNSEPLAYSKLFSDNNNNINNDNDNHNTSVNDNKLTIRELKDFVVGLTVKIFEQLKSGNYPALREAAGPFAELIPENEFICACATAEDEGRFLQLQKHKPLALPLLTPDFSTDYSIDSRGGRRGDDKNDASRMKRALKREFKGAVRELKRDAAFLAEHRVKETRRKDAEYKSKMNKIIGNINNGV